MADGNDRNNATRTEDLVSTVFTLHDRLTALEVRGDTYQEGTTRDTASISAAVIELRRFILLFGMVAFVALIVSLVIGLHVITTGR